MLGVSIDTSSSSISILIANAGMNRISSNILISTETLLNMNSRSIATLLGLGSLGIGDLIEYKLDTINTIFPRFTMKY